MKNEDKLELTDIQIGQIKALKLKTKKDVIKKDADIEILGLDVSNELWKEDIDTAAVAKIIDEKYSIKAEKAKALVSAYAELKNILTSEQKEKMKSFWKESKKRVIKHSSMMHGKMMDKQ